MIIAIDGPAGTGKSTIARKLATKLGYFHLDTGALYRWATYQILTQGGINQDKQTLIKIAQDTDYTQINDRLIRTSQVSDAVPHIAPIPEIREHIRKVQHQLASTRDVVVEGRDIGTVVFPQAECKIFLTASAEIRAYRRYLEMYGEVGISDNTQSKQKSDQRDRFSKARNQSDQRDQFSKAKNQSDTKMSQSINPPYESDTKMSQFINPPYKSDPRYQEILKSIEERDHLDRTRAHSPMVCAEDAIIVDTSDIGIEEVLGRLEREVGLGDCRRIRLIV